MADENRAISVDAIIIGGGLVGMTLALALSSHGLEVAVVDSADLNATLEASFDGRASAIANASAKMFQAIGVWPHLADVAQPIRKILVTDGDSPRFLQFDSAAIGDEPLGYMFENRLLRAGLMAAYRQSEGIRLHAPDRLVSWNRSSARVEAVLASGTRLVAPLLVSAEGRRSSLREQVGIRVAQWSYRQHGIVTTVAHEKPHGDVAHERFLPNGPFAILPLQHNRSGIVWTVSDKDGPAYMGLSDRAFLAELQRRFGDFLGKVELAAPRWSYPLGFIHAERYIDDRFALIGDSAHGIHPIAGQGLNMGLRDVAAFTQVLVESARIGLDIGSPDVLRRYQQWRRPDNVSSAAVMDGLVRLFSNDLKTVTFARRFGIGLVNRIPPLKGFFMREAMGATGKLPRLLQGERA
ncbi:UbiH/UbiF/VisC/COQ6 family ubiquinone biosynthesis hydroxylase [Pedomonas sp. V897]|uniref:UbiH/UbiF/VisC/COQ6 family ubiquinone biosynthesis hydroxylase n=1 Tax=Pedomonas sp. V897 TaxID=3446482 RepID=UPI003EE23F13